MIKTRKRIIEVTELECPSCGEWIAPTLTITDTGKGTVMRANCRECNCSFEAVVSPT